MPKMALQAYWDLQLLFPKRIWFCSSLNYDH